MNVFAGANCSDGTRITPTLRGSQWQEVDGVWSLTGCPPGFVLDQQSCRICPATWYCPGGAVQGLPCGIGYFSLPGTASVSACTPVVYTIVTSLIPVLRQEFTDATSVALQEALAGYLRFDPGYVMIVTVSQSTSQLSTLVTAHVATSDAKAALNLAGSIYPDTFTSGLAIQDFPQCSLTSVGVTACPAGFEFVSTSSTCNLCPAQFYCVGGTAGPSPCPIGAFALPGANASTSCNAADFVIIALSLSQGAENSTLWIDKLKSALAATANVRPETIVLELSNSIQSRRASTRISAQIAVPPGSASAVAERISASSLNAQLELRGLPPASQISVAVTGATSAGSGSTVALIVGTAVGCFAAVVASLIAIYFSCRIRKESEEDKLLHAAMNRLREKLGITRKHGFVLSTESAMRSNSWLPTFADKPAKEIAVVTISKRYMEAAARLALQQVRAVPRACRTTFLACCAFAPSLSGPCTK